MLHLPRWATDCLKRADPALGALDGPFALWEKQRGAIRLVEVDAAAAALGIGPGQTLSDARAQVPALAAREIDRQYLSDVFADFADWHSNATPLVAIHPYGGAWGDLVLDITGVSHLFGGEETMLAMLIERLRGLGYSVEGAIAPTIGAAWALAHFIPGVILGVDKLEDALGRLPVAALRLEPGQVESLKQLGLKQIGQLYDRDRRSLKARFSEGLLTRLDQALGSIEEKLTPRLPIVERYVERRFPEPVALIEDVLMTARDLSITLSVRLEAEGVGAQAFHLFLYRVDHKVMTLTVNAARATRDAVHIGRLFSYRIDRLGGEYDAGFGIDMIRLAASSLSPLDASQLGTFETNEGAHNLEHLYDRMTSRLGPLAVLRAKPVNSYIPEQAVRLEPVVARTPDQDMPPVAEPRPLKLLPAPERISVVAEVPNAPPVRMVWRRVTYRFVKASGPERIAAEWQQTRMRLKLTKETLAAGHTALEQHFEEGMLSRDYYITEDEGGRRFWLFRLGLFGVAAEPRWYLHGFFA